MSFTERWISIFILFSLLITGATAEETEPTDNAPSSLLSRIRENHKEDPAADRFNNNFLIVRSPDGRGSAFLTKLWDQPVIVTNAHVFLEMKDPEVVDINGKVYQIKEVIGSKSRDLVILSYEDAELTDKILWIVKDVGAVPLTSKVTAYGNSLGDDVIVTQDGALLGIGPDKIETDAPFVSGNSGGPVLLSKAKEVIGVATYLRILKPNRTTSGSKYDSSVKQVVRRFATRIDNLTPDDLEVLKLSELDAERELVLESDEWVDYIQTTFEKKLSHERFQEFRSGCFKRAKILINGEAIEWHSSYLKNKFNANREMIIDTLNLFELNTIVELSRIGVALEHNLDQLQSTQKIGPSVRCFFCRGSGKESNKRNNPAYRPNSASVRYIIETKPCPICDDNGFRPLWPERFCFSMPPEVTKEIGQKIEICEEKFCGFQLGGKQEEELKRFVFYRKKPLYTFPNSFGETRVYAGNHQDQSAACTWLTFMFGRLLSVSILTSQIKGGAEEGLERYHQGEISDTTPMFINVFRIQNRADIPLDLRGNPLLRPVRPENFDDPPRYDGMLIVGAHSSLSVIAGMDLPALAKRTRNSQSQ